MKGVWDGRRDIGEIGEEEEEKVSVWVEHGWREAVGIQGPGSQEAQVQSAASMRRRGRGLGLVNSPLGLSLCTYLLNGRVEPGDLAAPLVLMV